MSHEVLVSSEVFYFDVGTFLANGGYPRLEMSLENLVFEKCIDFLLSKRGISITEEVVADRYYGEHASIG